MINYNGIIKENGIAFSVITVNKEIIFIDDNEDTLTWELNKENLALVKEMINTLV